MSNQKENQQHEFTDCENSQQTADHLLMDAISSVPKFTPLRVDERIPETILIAAHALVAKFDAIETTLIRIVTPQTIKPTEHEKQVIYRALEADYIAQGNAPDIEGMDDALARFKAIAGL